MKQYDLYGIGNALVDLEFRVSDEKLSELEVDNCLLYTSPSPRDRTRSRMPSSA